MSNARGKLKWRSGHCFGLLAFVVSVLALAHACQPAAPTPAPAHAPLGAPVATESPEPAAPSSPVPTATPKAERVPLLLIDDPKTLRELAEGAGNLGMRAFGAMAKSTAELKQTSRYQSLLEVLERDLAEDRARDRMAGVGLRHAHRQFDQRWLSSESTHFELIAVVNRIDRAPFNPTHCGELRLLYRLAYRIQQAGQTLESRLPMTLNVVFWLPRLPASGCQEIVAKLRLTNNTPRESADLVSELVPTLTLKSVEVNLQSVRWPATVRPNMAGHAAYILRVFEPREGDRLSPAKLENTLDVGLLERKPALKQALLSWLTQPHTLRSLDLGVLRIPQDYLATQATSVTPHGLGRLGNRPASQTLSKKLFETLDLRSYRTISSPEALLRRLDGLSCQGCHQSRSVAGFHALGHDPKDKAVDALRHGLSPHVVDDLVRRRAHFARLMAGKTPDPFRPAAERSLGKAGPGGHCSLGTPGFEDWTCEAGLVCIQTTDPLLGRCFHEQPSVGEACELGTLSQTATVHRDYVGHSRQKTCADGRVCEANAVGFPGGMCAGACSSLGPDAVCGGIAILDSFNACLAAGTPFATCVSENTRPGALQRCDLEHPCRDDYVCARLPSGDGGCIPPYFLFQLRVDGHPG